MMGVVGILIGLGVLVWLAYRGWTILLLAPLCALIAALLAGQPVHGLVLTLFLQLQRVVLVLQALLGPVRGVQLVVQVALHDDPVGQDE